MLLKFDGRGDAMSFLDELKGKCRSTDEVEKEKQASLIDKVNRDAQEAADRIKGGLLMSVKRGEYTYIGDKKTANFTCYLPVDYYQRREVPATYTKNRRTVFSGKQPPIMDMDSYLKALMSLPLADRRKYNLVQQTPAKTIFEAKNVSTYTMFITKLTELLSDDGIEVMPIIFNAKTGKELGFPCEVEGKVYWLDYSFVAKCTCVIPEKFSTDIPMYVYANQITDVDIPQSQIPDTPVHHRTNSIDVDVMEGHEFEGFCAGLLRKNGFENVSVTRGSGDQGIDIIASKDGIKYGIQCKCYTADIGNKAVQEALAGKTFYKCHVAVVLTNRYFTRSARELADSTGIILWDRSRLLKLMKMANITVDGQ